MNELPSFSAVLLAGGKSTRMGRDKAGLMIDGQPLWQRQLATLRATAPQELFISGRLDGPYAADGVPIVPDAVPGLGPLGGLVAALRHAQHPYLLVLAIDLPAITSEFLQRLRRGAETLGVGIVPSFDGRFEPLAALYPRACLPLAEEHLRRPDRSLQTFVRAAFVRGYLGDHPLATADRPLFHNLNTPADLPPA